MIIIDTKTNYTLKEQPQHYNEMLKNTYQSHYASKFDKNALYIIKDNIYNNGSHDKEVIVFDKKEFIHEEMR